MKLVMKNWKWEIGNWKFPQVHAGFTLIEIVLVIALLGISASVVISLINPAQQFKKANDAKRKADLKQLQAALELYRADQDEYPDEPLPNCGSPLVNTSGTIYIQKIPCDPKNTPPHVYTYSKTTPNTYSIFACLENSTDRDKDESNNDTYCAGGEANWSYTVTNP